MADIEENDKSTPQSGIIDYYQSFFKNLYELRQDATFCDVKLQVSEEIFMAHRIVLMSGSAYFHAMFATEMSEHHKDEVMIGGVTPSIFKALLDFIYSGKVNITEENCEDLLTAADMLSVTGVVDACCLFMRERFQPENCIGIYLFSDAISCSCLTRDAEAYINKNFLKVVQEEEFMDLPKESLVHFLHSENLRVENEFQVFKGYHALSQPPRLRCQIKNQFSYFSTKTYVVVTQNHLYDTVLSEHPTYVKLMAAIDWILHDIPARKRHVFEVMSPIRFPIIPEKQMDKYITTLQETDISLNVALTKILADFRIDHRKAMVEKKYYSKIKHSLTVPRKCARKNIYVVGGFTRPKGGRWSDAKTLSSVERFDTFYHTWHDLPSCQFPRSSMGSGVINGQVCVVGGENDSLIFDSVETYDPVTHEWTLLPGMTTPRCGLGVCTLDNCLYALGGWVGSEIGRSVEKYDPDLGKWSVIGYCRNLKCWMGVVADKGLIYVVGGSNDLSEELKAAECYNPITKEWITLPDMIVKRAYPGVVILDDYLYVVGGWNESEGALNSVERLSLTAGHWTEISPMSCSRAAASVCAVNGMIYVLGGRSYKDQFTAPATLDSMECYNPSTDTWTDAGCMPTSRCEGAAVVI